jgi:hypothetical protein
VKTKAVGQPSFTRRTALAGAVSILGSGAAAQQFGRASVDQASAAALRSDHALMSGSMHNGFAEGRTTVDP